MTLTDILNARNVEIEPVEEPVKYTEPTEEVSIADELEKERKADAEELTRLAKNMKRYEKEAVAKGIPMDILQNEISRRMNIKHKALMDVKNILSALEEY